MFVDSAQLIVRAGDGGNGSLSFRHEKYRAMGGPDGGDGGKGGDVIFVADHNAHTLSKFRTARTVEAPSGQPGSHNRRAGKQGEAIIVKVPVGTQVHAGEEVIADLTEPGAEAVVARGGRGGFGNAHFTSSVRQAPRIAERGEPGEQRTVQLELKLVADVGLVGLPNAGKSTFLSVISNARPEIADYPFTTLVPNLGVVQVDDGDMVVADIPGLIEGASEGRGLGDAFLRHVERTAVLIHLVDVHSDDPLADYVTISQELERYSPVVAAKPRLVVLTKIEGVDAKHLADIVKQVKKATGTTVLTMSSRSGQGVQDVLRAAFALVQQARREHEAESEAAARPVITLRPNADAWNVTPQDGGWRVTGERLEGFAKRTNFDSTDGVNRLRDILRKTGVAKELERQGAQAGDVVYIANETLEWL